MMSKFFSYFLYVEDMSIASILFYDKSPIVLRTMIKNTANQLSVNEFLLYRSSRDDKPGVTRPRGPVQTGYVAQLSRATPYGVTSPSLPELCRYVA
jgi:hypothetical protein